MSSNERIFWIEADAGMGKSVFASHIVHEVKKTGRLLAYFFCKSGQKGRSDGESLVMNLSYQIATKYVRHPKCHRAILKALRDINQDHSISLEKKFHLLISKPLREIGQQEESHLLVIDALDEIGVDGLKDRFDILRILTSTKFEESLPKWVKLLITSRGEVDIKDALKRIRPQVIDKNDPEHIRDLEMFIRPLLKDHLNRSEDEDEATALLLRKSQNIFICLSLIAHNNLEGRSTYSLKELSNDLPEGLDAVYIQCFQRIFSCKFSFVQTRIKPMIQLLVCKRGPLPVHEVQALLKCSDEDMDILINRLANIFPVEGEGAKRAFRNEYHKTALDFLLDANKSRKSAEGKISLYWLQKIFPGKDCLDLELDVLKHFRENGYCTFEDVMLLNNDSHWSKLSLTPRYEVKLRDYFQSKKTIATGFTDEMEYDFFIDLRAADGVFCQDLLSQIHGYESGSSLLFLSTLSFPTTGWKYLYEHLIDHMVMCGRSDEAKMLLLNFNWLEVSILRRPQAVSDIWKDMRITMGKGEISSIHGLDDALKLVAKAVRMSESTLSGIGDRQEQWWSLLLNLVGRLRATASRRQGNVVLQQMMNSCLQLFKDRQPVYPVKYNVEQSEGVLQAILLGHKKYVRTVCLSSDDRIIVSGSDDETIKIWDADTGVCEMTLEGHNGLILAACISSNNRRIISGSEDKTIKIWDATIGTCDMTLEGHKGSVNAVCLSSDNNRIISGSWDKTIKIWNATTGACEMTLEGHQGYVTTICLTSDDRRIVSGSTDRTIKIWDATAGVCELSLTGHSRYIYAVCLSSDNRRIISGSEDKTIKIWNTATGECETTIEGHIGSVYTVSITSDGRKIVSGSNDHSIKVWDVSTGICEMTIEGHDNSVRALCLSSDGKRIISASKDKSIKIWDTTVDTNDEALEGHIGDVTALCISSDKRKIVSGSWDQTIKVWDAVTGACKMTIDAHSDVVRAVCLSFDGLRIISSSKDKTIKIWDATSGKCEMTLEGHRGSVNSVCISSDDRKIISGSHDQSVKVWDAVTGACAMTLEGHYLWVNIVSLSSDGLKIISGSWDKTIKIWNIATGACETTLEGHRGGINAVYLSLDGTKLVSGSDDQTIKIWDVHTESCEMTLEGHFGNVKAVYLSSDNKRIISGSHDQTVKVWDAESGASLESYCYSALSFFAVSSDSIEEPIVCDALASIEKYHADEIDPIAYLLIYKDGVFFGSKSGSSHLFASHRR